MVEILAKTLKDKLNEDCIIRILESIGCHHIKVHSNRINSALKDGDNINSVCIYTNTPYYSSEIFTRGEFKEKQHRDIISVVEYCEKLSFPMAVKRICDICSFDYYTDIQEDKTPKILKWLDFVEKGIKQEDDTVLSPLSESVLKQFIRLPVLKWLNEGVRLNSQRMFEIGFDIDSERIVIPIRDEIGSLVGVKGRLLDDKAISNDKYMYLYPCAKSKLLYGLYQNFKDIIKVNEVIVVEGEKSVIKLNSLGYKNAVSVGSKAVSDYQIELLLRLNVPITLALDKDVDDDEIEKLVYRIKYPILTVPLYVIKDKLGLLDEKESPPDNKDTWNILYKNFKFLM